MHELRIKKVFTQFIAILFTVFSFASVLLFVLNKSIRTDFTLFKSNYLWVSFLILYIVLAIAMLFVIHKFLLKLHAFKSSLVNILLILTIAFVTRLLWINLLDVIPKNDFQLYQNFATHYAQGDYVGQGYISLFPHTFGYPAVLSLLYRIFGTSVSMAQLLNVFLGCGITVLVYALGKKLFDMRTGTLAALFYAFWPSQIFYSVLVSSEALFTFIMLMCIWLFLKILDTKSKMQVFIHFVILALLCTMLNSIRPLGILLIASFIVTYLLHFLTLKATLREILLLSVAPVLLFLLSYMLFFNLASSGVSRIIKKDVAKSPLGFNLYIGSNEKNSGKWNAQDAKILSDMIDYGPFNAQGVHDKLARLAVERYRMQGLSNINLFMEKYKIMWLSDDDILTYIKAGLDEDTVMASHYKFISHYLRILCNLYYFLMILLCGVFSFWFVKGKINHSAIVLMLIILGVVAIHTLVEVHGRYHYPVIPLLALLASSGICKSIEMWNLKRSDKQ